LDFQKLKLFEQVAEHGSLTKAAVALDSVPSAISRQISALERECGGRLFHRTGRGVALSELGTRILPRVRALLAEANHLSVEIKASAGVPVGEVRFGVLPSLSHPLVNLLHKQIRAQFPGIHIYVFEGSSGQLDEWLANGQVDIAILFRYGKSEIGKEQALAVVDTYLVGPAGDTLTKAATVQFERLDKLPLILPGAPNGLRVTLDQKAKKMGITLNVVLEANSLPIQKDFTEDGTGYTILAGHAVMREVKAGTLQASRIVEPGVERIITLGTTTHRPATLASREVARLVRKNVEDISASLELRPGKRQAS
jgi:LysR family nitrogen assimilation transcriptional regulator